MDSDLTQIVNLNDFERAAAERLDIAQFDYIAGGADDELTLAANQEAFRRWSLVPRVLNDVASVNPEQVVLGKGTSLPVGIAPMAFQHFAHPDAELASARAAATAGVIFCLSTMSSRSIEEVAEASGSGRRWFQLYVHRDRRRSEDLVHRAEAAGYEALVVTVDFPVAGKRERDLRNDLRYPQVFGNFEFASEPAQGIDISAVIGGFNDASFGWADLAWLRDLTSMPILLKGILAADDATLAVEHGLAGVIVSNHGGRQLDRTAAAIDQLPEIVSAVAGRAEVYLDGGVRRGTDVLVALALGARGVFLGRPVLYSLAAAGEAGVAQALQIIRDELVTDMALLGVSGLADLTPAHVRRG